jgi:hypothetical protein
MHQKEWQFIGVLGIVPNIIAEDGPAVVPERPHLSHRFDIISGEKYMLRCNAQADRYQTFGRS